MNNNYDYQKANGVQFDSRFKVNSIRYATSARPNKAIYMAMHQDYYAGYVLDDKSALDLREDECAERVIKHLLKGGKGHYGPLEHPVIQTASGYFPHSVMQQLRTHRMGISFDVQSFRSQRNKFLWLQEKKFQWMKCLW